jgi:hypothetical protein
MFASDGAITAPTSIHSNANPKPAGLVTQVARIGLTAALVVLGTVAFGLHGAEAQTVDIGDAHGVAGTTVRFVTTLNGAGNQVVGLTQRIDFTPVTHVPPNPQGKPDCLFAPAITSTKANSSFSYFPAGCDPLLDCTRINVTIVDLGDNAKAPIVDGLLYTCNFHIPSSANAGMSIALTNSRSQITKPNNQTVDVTGDSKSGLITVVGPTPSPTRTPTATPSRTPTRTFTATPTRTPTPTPTLCVGACSLRGSVTIADLLSLVNVCLGTSSVSLCRAGDANRDGRVTIDEVLAAVNNARYGCGMPSPTPTRTATSTRTRTPTPSATPTPTATRRVVSIEIGASTGAPGGTTQVEVRLRTSGLETAGTGNDIIYDSDAFDLSPSDCKVNPAIDKQLVVSLLPEGSLGQPVRIFVQSPHNASLIPDGPLYTCTFHIKPSTLPDCYVLYNESTIAFAPDGRQHPLVRGHDGAIEVSLVPTEPGCTARDRASKASPDRSPLRVGSKRPGRRT